MTSRRRRVRLRLRRGAYLLPSLFTIGNLLLGFYAIIRALHGDFPAAGAMIIFAAVLDSLDGRIARLTHTESDFGREYDSLADVVTFGVTPALVAYLWGLAELRRAGWLVPAFYLVCAATRLARFNVQSTRIESRDFVGLPSPAAAATIATIFLVAPDRDWRPWLLVATAVALFALGTLMVSTFRYPSFKRIDLGKRRSYRVLIPIAAGIVLLALHPPLTLPAVAVSYAISGPLLWLKGRLLPRDTAEPPPSEKTA